MHEIYPQHHSSAIARGRAVCVGGWICCSASGLYSIYHKEKGMLAFALREPGITGSVIDVLVRSDVPYERLSADATHMPLFGANVAVASIDHLLEMKRIANRPKDRIDIEALEKIKRGESPDA
jgi:hypothetical protein